MYSNVGKSVKGYATGVARAGYTMSVIGAIIFCIIGAGNNDGYAVIIAALIVMLGCFVTWFLKLVLYAYGEIADRLISIDERFARVDISEIKAAVQDDASCGQEKNPCSFYCHHCGARNNQDAKFCCSCGQHFDN